MALPRTLPPEARRILELAEQDRSAAQRAFAAHAPEQQVALVCEAPLAWRARLLALSDEPEQVVPLLPPAELCHVAKAVGLPDAGWLLAHATREQLRTCIDLDAWDALVPDRARVGEWIAALADAGEDALLEGARALDAEMLTLHLKSRVDVVLKPGGSEGDDFEPPPGARSIDGQFHLIARDPNDDLADLIALLQSLFQHDYWFYFRMLQAVIWELEPETEEWALRWRTGRLSDLGFPPWDEAMAIYGWLRPERLDALPPAGALHPVGEWPLPVWMPGLPADADSEHALFRAIAALPEDERRPYLFAFLSLANQVAVAERLPLGDAESLPAAIEKAARVASAGLQHLAERNGVDAEEVLRRTPLPHLFRVGFNLDDTLEAPRSAEALGGADAPGAADASDED